MGNKKGDILVLRMIIGIVIALTFLFFFASCTSNLALFTTSLEPNFDEFAGSIKEMKRVGETKQALLTLPEGAALVYFEPEQEVMRLTVDDSTMSNYDVVFTRVEGCEKEKACLCLYRETEVKEEGSFNGNSQAIVTSPKKISCVKDFAFALKVDSCNLGTPKDVVSYQCIGGFAIERRVVYKARDAVKVGSGDGHYDLFAKTQFTLEHRADGLYITQ